MKGKDDYKEKYNKLKIHSMYCIIIISIICISLFVTRGYSNSDLSGQLGFAGTISGIILSVLAIIITLLGEMKSENTKEKLLNISSDLEEVVKTVKNTTEGFDDMLMHITNTTHNVNEIKNTNDQINKRIDELSEFGRYDLAKIKSKDIYINEEDDSLINYVEVFRTFEKRSYKKLSMNLALLIYYVRRRVEIKPEIIKYVDVISDFIMMDLYNDYLEHVWDMCYMFDSDEMKSGKLGEYIDKYIEENYVDHKCTIDKFINEKVCNH